MNDDKLHILRSKLSLRHHIRAYTRIFLFGVWLLLTFPPWVLIDALLTPSLRTRVWLRSQWQKFICRGILKIFRVTLVVEGPPPEPPYFLVTNHLSYIDIIILFAVNGGVFVAKKEIRSWFFIGYIAHRWGTLFIDRKRKKDVKRILSGVDKHYKQQAGIITFAEGTTSDGQRILPLKTPLLQFASENNFPVHVATLHYSTPQADYSARHAVCWWGEANFFPHLLLFSTISSLTAHVVFSRKTIKNTCRKSLALDLHQHMSATHAKQRKRKL